jgi:drug/metabolite transporter (DMT)-like permease
MFLMVVATLCFTTMHAGVRHLTAVGDLHPFEAAFFRNFFGLLALLPWFMRVRLAALRTQKLGLHALRASLQVVGMLCFFMALKLSPLAEVSALSFTAPLFASLGATLFLGEVMRLRRWSALMLGFVGALVIIRPGFEALSLGTSLVILSSVVWSGAMLVIKTLARTDSSVTITAYMALFLTPLSLLPALFVWRAPSLAELLVLAAVGAVANLGHLAMAQSFKEAEVTVVLPFDFTRLIWASVFGYLLFAEVPDLWTWAGGVVIFASTTYIAVRESRLKRVTGGAAPTPRPPPPG